MYPAFIDFKCLYDALDEVIVFKDVAVLFLPLKPFCRLFFFRGCDCKSFFKSRQAEVSKNLLKRVEEAFNRLCLCVLYPCKDSAVLLFPLGFCRNYINDESFRVLDDVASVLRVVEVGFVKESDSVILEPFNDVVCEL